MPLSREQLNAVSRARKQAVKLGATRIEKQALVAAMGVESNYTHLTGGDRDSTGILQQRPSQGWGPIGESIEKDVSQFLKAARAYRGQINDPGKLAQAVQRSAFPDRYGERLPEAKAALKAVRGQKGSASKSVPSPGRAPRLVPGSTTVDHKGAMTAALLDTNKDRGLLDRYNAQVSSGSHTVTTPDKVRPGKYKVISEPGKPQPAGKKTRVKGDIAELFWNGPDAANIKNGKKVDKGFVSGHTDHVHVAASRALLLKLAKLAEEMGLSVREFRPYDPVDPVHADGSHHYTKARGTKQQKRATIQAMDVSGERMAEFANLVARGAH